MCARDAWRTPTAGDDCSSIATTCATRDAIGATPFDQGAARDDLQDGDAMKSTPSSDGAATAARHRFDTFSSVRGTEMPPE